MRKQKNQSVEKITEFPIRQLSMPSPNLNAMPLPDSFDHGPSDDWDSATLGEFAHHAVRKTAEHIWMVGRALTLAKAACRQEKIKFTAWTKQWVSSLTAKTRERWMKVAKKLDFEEVKGKKVHEVYKMALGEDYAGDKAKRNRRSKPQTVAVTEMPSAEDASENPRTEAMTEHARAVSATDRPNNVAIPVEQTKVSRVKEAIETLTEMTTAPDEWAAEIVANREGLTKVAHAILVIVGKN